MSTLEINIPSPAPYKARLRTNLRTPLILTAIFALVAIGFRNLMHTDFLKFLIPVLDIIALIIAVIVQVKNAEKEELFFITSLKMSPEKIEISYTQKDELKEVSGTPDEFEFRKKQALGRTGSSYQQSYLEVYYHNQLLIRQYSTEKWTDMKFIEIVYSLKN